MLARPRTRLVSILVAGPALFALAAVTPLWNLDSVGYAGLARSWLGQGEREVHVGVYGDLQVAAPARGAKEISASTGYRQTLAADSFTFSRQLPLYKNKPLYIALTAGTTALGGNSLRAPFLVSAASFGVLGMIVVLWCTAILGQAKGLLFAACLLLSPVVREIGQIATPDALASALALGASYLLVHKQDWKLSTVLLALSILCRPDQLFLALALVFWARSLFPQRYIAALIGFMMAVIALFVAIWSGAYPWSLVFVHTFVHALTTSADFASTSLRLSDYLLSVARGMAGDFVMHPSVVLLFAAWSFVCCVSGSPRQPGNPRSLLRLHILLWLSLLAHFAIFPMFADRFFIVQYLALAITSAEGCSGDGKPAGGGGEPKGPACYRQRAAHTRPTGGCPGTRRHGR